MITEMVAGSVTPPSNSLEAPVMFVSVAWVDANESGRKFMR